MTGFIEDLFAVGVLAGIITFAVIRLVNNPNGKAATPGSPDRTPAPRGSFCWGSSW